MDHSLRIALNGTPTQFERLRALQVAFADVCNAIAPVVQSTRCWNRVALHHLVYRSMRERFPALGSQMICNAVYSVSRTARLVLQHPKSPWNVKQALRRDAAAAAALRAVRPSLLRPPHAKPQGRRRYRCSRLTDACGSISASRARRRGPLPPGKAGRSRCWSATASGFELTFQFAGPDRAGRLHKMSAKGLLPEYVLVIPPKRDRRRRRSGRSLPAARRARSARRALIRGFRLP